MQPKDIESLDWFFNTDLFKSSQNLLITNSYDGNNIMLCSCKCGCDNPAGSIDGCLSCRSGACSN